MVSSAMLLVSVLMLSIVGHLVKSDANQQLACNVNSTFHCTCVNCGGGDGSVGCCDAVLPSIIVSQGVVVSLTNYSDAQLTSTFEDELKKAIADAVTTYCTPDPKGLCNKDVSNGNNLSATVLVIKATRPEDTTLLEVAFAILLEERSNSSSSRRKRSAVLVNQNNDEHEVLIRRSRAVTATSVKTSDVMPYGMVIQMISDQSTRLTSALGVVVSPTAKVFQAEEKTLLTESTIAGIVVGSILGCIFLLICVISARKAVRDRANMKARIESRKAARQKITDGESYEPVHSNGISSSSTFRLAEKKTAIEVNGNSPVKSSDYAYSNTVTVEAEICQPAQMANGNVPNGASNGHVSHIDNKENATDGSPQSIPTEKRAVRQYSSQDSNNSLPNGHSPGLPQQQNPRPSDDESTVSPQDVTWSTPSHHMSSASFPDDRTHGNEAHTKGSRQPNAGVDNLSYESGI